MNATETKREERFLSIFCTIDRHNYCFSEHNSHCGCNCHRELKTIGGANLGTLAYNLWQISSATRFMEDAEREAHFLNLIRAAEGTVDFRGFSAEEFLEKLQPTLARDYWSRFESGAELGIEGWLW